MPESRNRKASDYERRRRAARQEKRERAAYEELKPAVWIDSWTPRDSYRRGLYQVLKIWHARRQQQRGGVLGRAIRWLFGRAA